MHRVLVGLLIAGCTCPPGAPICPIPGDAGQPESHWSTVLDEEDLDGTVQSIWGPSSREVWGVGGALGNGQESLAVRFVDGRWERMHPGGQDTYWWVHGTASDDIWLVGEHGRITHFNGTAFTEHARPTTATLWGVFAYARDDVWAVGGSPDQGPEAPNDLVFHFDGTSWTRAMLPESPRGLSLFKVWGAPGGELFVVGEGGIIWHRMNGSWTDQSNPVLTRATLFTVHGCSASDVWAVGGSALLHFDGFSWSKAGDADVHGANGVACGARGTVSVVGFGSVKMRRVNGAFIDDSAQEPFADLHAVFDDGAGSIWASGGDWLGRVNPGHARPGVIGRFGPGSVATGF